MIPSTLKFLICIVATELIALLQSKFNLNKRSRHAQSSFVYLGILYSLAATVVLMKYRTVIIERLLTSSILSLADIFVLNMAVGVLFLLVKGLYMLIYSGDERRKPNGDTAGEFYEYKEKYSQWFLQKRWITVRNLFKILVYVIAGISGLFYGMTWVLGTESIVWIYVFPIIIQLILIEIYSFLDGYTEEEFKMNVFGDDVDVSRISNFFKIREAYEKLLPSTILSATTAADFSPQKTSSDKIINFEKSGENNRKLAAQFYRMNEDSTHLDTDAMEATIHLMDKKNIVFFNPFYRDLSDYIALPLLNALFSNRKVLFIVGRNSVIEDVKKWTLEIIRKHCNMNALWRIKELGDITPECEIGILSSSGLHNVKTIEANKGFISDAGFVVLIEPSRLIATSQIGLGVITEELHSKEEPVFCIIDRQTDGLVDSLSHILQTEFTDVIAPPVPKSIYTGISFNADGDFRRQELFDKETKYLGNGVELAAIAAKNQVPKIKWYGETKAPIKDIKWIAGQYYPVITRYMHKKSHQQSLYETIDFIPNLWESSKEKEQFIVAEDEFCNMFSTMKTYLSRGGSQTFVNVISENYLLRDYMRCNSEMFLANPNAIPSIVADYAKTERNVVMKLLLMMSAGSIPIATVEKELRLLGYESDDAMQKFIELANKYTDVDETAFDISATSLKGEGEAVIESVNIGISESKFAGKFAPSLRSAYYVIEDEKYDKNFIDAKLYGHVAQTTLPGQFVSYEGKYYRVRNVTPSGGVILRRASDLYSGRRYYRQVRKYTINPGTKEDILNVYNVMDIEIAELCRNIEVDTTGYLDMRNSGDLRTARLIDFSVDNSVNKYHRFYKNKSLLRIKLPESTDRMRYTLCMLLQELFKSTFPDTWQYIAVTTARPEDIGGMLNYLVYECNGDYQKDYIYIIEDSDLDLGLLEAVERNMMKFMEIITDYLTWHFEKIYEPEAKDPIPGNPTLPANIEALNFLQKFFSKLLEIFKPKNDEEETSEKPEEEAVEEEPVTEEPKEEVTEAEEEPAAEEEVTEAEEEPAAEEEVTEAEEEPVAEESEEEAVEEEPVAEEEVTEAEEEPAAEEEVAEEAVPETEPEKEEE